jgi:hypothetical protein
MKMDLVFILCCVRHSMRVSSRIASFLIANGDLKYFSTVQILVRAYVES